MKKIHIFLIILTPIILLSISYLIFLKFRKIKYFKCPEKPNANLLNEVLQKNNFIKNDQNYNLYMTCGYNDVEEELENMNIPNSKYINALKGCDKIVSKSSIWFILQTKYGRYGAKKIMPESFLIEDIDEFNLAMNRVKNGEILIAKKNLQRKLGLKFIFNPEDLIEARDDEFIVAQKFLENTKTINGRKLNLRIYLLIIKKNNKIEFFINQNGKVLYTKEKTSGPIKFESHITSYQMDPELYEKENIPHNLKELESLFGINEYKNIWDKIIFKLTLLASASAPVFEYNKFNDKICFQLFGIDMILDGNEPYLLEINKGPDMIPKCIKDEPLKKNIYEEVFHKVGLIFNPFRKNNFTKIYTYN